ncbi:MAG: trypsin-like peptidase domain-containing protein [Tannerella sp.]|jgi:serine protease Do|nr:trypsin-like peptidase domain-containing protein [Tannerella sp.]
MKKWFIYLSVFSICVTLYSCKCTKKSKDSDKQVSATTNHQQDNGLVLDDDEPSKKKPEKSSDESPNKSDIDKATDATFIIYTYNKYGRPSGYGSGFFIQSDGVGITNYHVLDKSVKAFVVLSDGTSHEIKQVISSDKDWDIAVFRIAGSENKQFSTLKFADAPVQIGGKVYNIGNPHGWRNSFSDGVVASFREDRKREATTPAKGEMVQITVPFSQGSSGSAIMNERFEVFAVAKGSDESGQNLNFGMLVDKEKILAMVENDFVKNNPKFNSKNGDFIILNIPSDIDDELVLNAIDFGETATTLYMTYKNLDLTGINLEIWRQLYKPDKGFMILDKTHHEKDKTLDRQYNLTYSEQDKIGPYFWQFKVHFPIIREKPQDIDVIWNCKTSKWQFKGINLDKFRESPNVNFDDIRKELAIAIIETDMEKSKSILLEILEENPNDVDVLIALGIISFRESDNSKAIEYFSKAIETNPNSATAYKNRAFLYMNFRNTLPNALEDLDKAITIDAKLHHLRDVYNKYKCPVSNNHCKDIYIAYQLTKDKEVERLLLNLWNDKCGGN